MDDMKSTIQGIASKGRNGDSMLVHMAPEEVQGIASLGMVSVNPETGLPEMFKFKDFLKIAVPIAITAMAPAAGAAAGAKATTMSPGILKTGMSFLGSAPGKALLTGAAQFAGQRLVGTDEKDALNAGIMAGATYGAASAAQKAFGPNPQEVAKSDAAFKLRQEQQKSLLDKMAPDNFKASVKEIQKSPIDTTKYYGKTVNPNLTRGEIEAAYDAAAADFDVGTRNFIQDRFGYQLPDALQPKGVTTTLDNVNYVPEDLAFVSKGDIYSGLGAGAVGAMSVPPEEIEEEKRKRRAIAMAQPYSTPATFPGAGYGSGEYSYFGPNYGLYAKEGGHIKQMQEGGIVDAAPALAPPPSPSELGLGEPPAPVENVGIAAPMPEEIQTTTQQDILPINSPAFTQNVPASAFSGDLMAFAPGILGGARYGMGAMPAARPVNTTEFGYDVFNPNIRGYDYRSFVPADMQGQGITSVGTGMGTGMGTGEQVTGSPNVIADTKKASGSRSTGTFKPYLDYTPMSKIGERDYTPAESNRMFRDRLIGYNSDGTPRYERQLKYKVAGSGFDYSNPVQYKTRIIPIKGMNEGGITSLPQTQGQVEGRGDGMSDEVYGDIENQQEVALSKDEFIVPADVVSGLGNGSSDAGASKLYEMMARVRKARTGKETQPEEIRAEDFMPA